MYLLPIQQLRRFSIEAVCMYIIHKGINHAFFIYPYLYTTYTTTKQFFHGKGYMYTHNEKLEKLENFELINYSPKGD